MHKKSQSLTVIIVHETLPCTESQLPFPIYYIDAIQVLTLEEGQKITFVFGLVQAKK